MSKDRLSNRLPSDGKAEDVFRPITIEELHEDFRGFRTVETITYREEGRDYSATREMVLSRRAAAVIAWDPKLERLVLVRQFRLGSQMGLGAGFCTEVVAGLIEDGMSAEQTAEAELREEAGLDAKRTTFMFSFMTTPGVTDEVIDMFYCEVDASDLTEEGGLEEETEQTFPFTITLADALGAIDTGGITNAIAMLGILRFDRMKDALDPA